MENVINGSFRDTSGFLFRRNDRLYRQINLRYKSHYDQLMDSKLYDELVANHWLISHKEVHLNNIESTAYKIIQPEIVPFISYPYEWSFSQLKDAALLTLRIQNKALKKDFTLKDASAYNIQFLNSKPIFIDTLSFEKYTENSPWVAYKQFCQHFLAPLALMANVDIRMSQLLRSYIDGIPIDLASNALPKRTKLSFSLLTHIHLHAKSQIKHANDGELNREKATLNIKKNNLLALIDNLKNAIEKLHWSAKGTEWGDYYNDTNYSANAVENKKSIINDLVEQIKPNLTWDIGANTGVFSRVALKNSNHVVSWDVDEAAVEKHYHYLKQHQHNESILPLRLDLTNPSSGTGWACTERDSLEQRGKADLILALAIVHHLAISNNVPLTKIAQFFARLCNNLILEFVPKSDSQVQRLLSTREDIFTKYTHNELEMAFGMYFNLEKVIDIKGSERTIYYFTVK